MFSFEFCEILKSIYFKQHLRTAGSKTPVQGFVFNKVASLTAWRPLTVRSNLYKTTTPGTTQKWSSWTGGRLIKHLYKTTINQISLFLVGFSFSFIPTVNVVQTIKILLEQRLAMLRVLVPFLKIKNVLSYF